MKKTDEVEYCSTLLTTLGKEEKLNLLKTSSLTLREQDYLVNRYINGLTAKECADKFCITEHAYSKIQKKVFQKLYFWLKLTHRLSSE